MKTILSLIAFVLFLALCYTLGALGAARKEARELAGIATVLRDQAREALGQSKECSRLAEEAGHVALQAISVAELWEKKFWECRGPVVSEPGLLEGKP